MRVLKFGGKSLETNEKFKNICNFVKSAYEKDNQLVIVVSAIGNTTDKLIELSKEFGNNENSNRELAILLSTGETQSASLFAMHLNSINVPAKSLSAKDINLLTYGDYNNSKVVFASKQKILECLNNNIVAVIAGFQGVNKNGEITTLGRGGSDTTAVALASIFNTKAEIYSDYDGIFAGDPKLDNYKKLDFVSYDSMINMANAGAKVLDARAIKIAKNNKITILSKCSCKPYSSGTIVSSIEKDIITINQIDNLCKITITFSNQEKLNEILKNVFLILNCIKFYNFQIFNNYLEFFIEEKISNIIINDLSKKLNLLN